VSDLGSHASHCDKTYIVQRIGIAKLSLILAELVAINKIENCGLNIKVKRFYVLHSTEYGNMARSNPAVGPDGIFNP
jgi:hypothetical protein